MRPFAWKLPVVIAAAALVASACGSDEPSVRAVEANRETTVAAPSTTLAPPPTTVAELPTEAPDTTVETTVATSPPTTAVPPPPTGWTPTDFAPAAVPVGYSGNWTGEPSPPAPAEGALLADGYYDAEAAAPWSASSPNTVQLRIHRLDFCRNLPAGSCYDNPDDPDELGRDPGWSQTVDVPLDASTSVILDGFRCEPEQKSGSGADLAALLVAFDAAYQQRVVPLLASGLDDFSTSGAIAADPSDGFLGEADACPGFEGYAGVLRFIDGDAPVLLLQVVTTDGQTPITPTDLVRPNGVFVRDGVPSYYFYAGFYS